MPGVVVVTGHLLPLPGQPAGGLEGQISCPRASQAPSGQIFSLTRTGDFFCSPGRGGRPIFVQAWCSREGCPHSGSGRTGFPHAIRRWHVRSSYVRGASRCGLMVTGIAAGTPASSGSPDRTATQKVSRASRTLPGCAAHFTEVADQACHRGAKYSGPDSTRLQRSEPTVHGQGRPCDVGDAGDARNSSAVSSSRCSPNRPRMLCRARRSWRASAPSAVISVLK
jgi:hypothetical protein